MGVAMCFLWEMFFKVFGSGQYLTCAQEPRWLRVAWWTRTLYTAISREVVGKSAPTIPKGIVGDCRVPPPLYASAPPTPEAFAGNFPLFDERKGLRYRGLWQLLHTIKEQRGSEPGYFPPRWTGWNTGQFTFSLNSFYEMVFFIKFWSTFLSCIY